MDTPVFAEGAAFKAIVWDWTVLSVRKATIRDRTVMLVSDNVNSFALVQCQVF